MVGSMGRREAVTHSAGHPANVGLSNDRITAGPQSFYIIFNNAGTGKIGKACSQSQQYDDNGALFFIMINTKTNNKNIQGDPKPGVTQ